MTFLKPDILKEYTVSSLQGISGDELGFGAISLVSVYFKAIYMLL